MGKQLTRGLFFLFLALASGYLAWQMMLLARPDYTTETALLQTVQEEIPASGHMFRYESAVAMEQGGAGYLHYQNKSGQRVSAGGVLASLYATGEQLSASLEAARLEETIAQLDLMLSRPGIGLSGVADVDRSVNELVTALTVDSDAGTAQSAQDIKSQLAYQLTRRQLAMGEFDSAQELRDQLAVELRELKSQIQVQRTVKADRSGYFISRADGYEQIFNAQLAGTLTAAQLEELAATPPQSTADAIGKLVERYTWYFMCRVDDAQAAGLKEGQTYQLRFAYAPQTDMPAILQRKYASGQDGYVLTFAGTRMTTEMMLLRSHNVNIVVNQYEGLRINNEARRVVESQAGVYVRSGLTFEFRPIEVLYTSETYSIVRYEPGKSGTLKLYDEVVVTGKDIYDGRVVS